VPADLIIYAIVAAGLVFWLRGTLGTRQEGDEPATPPAPLTDIDKPANAAPDAKGRPVKTVETPEAQLLALNEDKAGIIGVEDLAQDDLIAIMGADKSFNIKTFMAAAQDAFVYVVEAFADGDRAALKDMLAPSVYKAFEQAITDREGREEIAQTEIHSIVSAQIIEAALNGKTAAITLRFVADETSVTKDKDGKIIAGHPEKTTRMTDIWTFSRDIKSRDPRWLVTETRGDFEGDNDTIPNAE